MKGRTAIGERTEEIPVFVYGTLMKGERFHEEYMQGARYLGKATAGGFALYDLGTYPAMIRCDEESVKGEVYLVNPSMLASIDELEGEGWKYSRTWQTISLESDIRLKAFCYLYRKSVEEEDKIPAEHQPWSAFSLYKKRSRSRKRSCLGFVL